MTALSHTRASPLAANLMCMASMIMWAAGLPAADTIIDKVPPLAFAAARMSLAALALLPFWLLMEGTQALRAANWPLGFLIGGATIGMGAFLLVVSQSMTGPVTVAVISATMPVVGIAIEVLLDGRRLKAGLIIGVLLSLCGGLLALDLNGGGLGFGWGALLCLTSVVLFTFGSRLTVTSFPKLTALGQTTITLSGAAVATCIAAAMHAGMGGPSANWSTFTLYDWGALLLFSVVGLAISQILWIIGVGRIGIALAALHINAAPFYVMLILFLMGQSWNWTQAAGAAIVGIGVLVAQNIITLRRN
ncbi:MAG: DMT family transporter [Paracoccaceae bacterium]